MTDTIVQASETEAQRKRRRYVQGLRQLSDVLERHPEVPLPYAGTETSPLLLFAMTPEAFGGAGRWLTGVTLADERNGTVLDVHLAGLHARVVPLNVLGHKIGDRVVYTPVGERPRPVPHGAEGTVVGFDDGLPWSPALVRLDTPSDLPVHAIPHRDLRAAPDEGGES